jgi:hypothetical protein
MRLAWRDVATGHPSGGVRACCTDRVPMCATIFGQARPYLQAGPGLSPRTPACRQSRRSRPAAPPRTCRSPPGTARAPRSTTGSAAWTPGTACECWPADPCPPFLLSYEPVGSRAPVPLPCPAPAARCCWTLLPSAGPARLEQQKHRDRRSEARRPGGRRIRGSLGPCASNRCVKAHSSASLPKASATEAQLWAGRASGGARARRSGARDGARRRALRRAGLRRAPGV